MAIFGKKKASADELLKALTEAMDAMSDDEYNDFIDRNAEMFGELEEAVADAKADDEPDKVDETDETVEADKDTETEQEEQTDDVEETTKEIEETDEEPAEIEDEEVDETEETDEPEEEVEETEEEVSEAPDGVTSAPQNDILEQFAARLSAIEDMLQKLAGKATEGDFGMRPDVPPQGEPEGTVSDAVLRGYAGANAYKYR